MGTPDTFLFSKPTFDDSLSDSALVTLAMGALGSQLVVITRTRCMHPDGRAENDAEHSFMLAKVAPELAHALYPELDENLVARFALLHDDVEAYVGDTPTDVIAQLDVEAKTKREERGIRKLLNEYAALPSYTRLVVQYDQQSVPEARFVRAVDKLMVLLIHIPNDGEVLRANYTYESFIQSDKDLLTRDGYKYGEFELIKMLRIELSTYIANRYLKTN